MGLFDKLNNNNTSEEWIDFLGKRRKLSKEEQNKVVISLTLLVVICSAIVIAGMLIDRFTFTRFSIPVGKLLIRCPIIIGGEYAWLKVFPVYYDDDENAHRRMKNIAIFIAVLFIFRLILPCVLDVAFGPQKATISNPVVEDVSSADGGHTYYLSGKTAEEKEIKLDVYYTVEEKENVLEKAEANKNGSVEILYHRFLKTFFKFDE